MMNLMGRIFRIALPFAVLCQCMLVPNMNAESLTIKLSKTQTSAWHTALAAMIKVAPTVDIRWTLEHAKLNDFQQFLPYLTQCYQLETSMYDKLQAADITPSTAAFTVPAWGQAMMSKISALQASFPIMLGTQQEYDKAAPLVQAQLNFAKHIFHSSSERDHKRSVLLKMALQSARSQYETSFPDFFSTCAWILLADPTNPHKNDSFSAEYWAYFKTIHSKPRPFFLFNNNWPVIETTLRKVLPLCEKLLNWHSILTHAAATVESGSPHYVMATQAMFQSFKKALPVILWFYHERLPSKKDNGVSLTEIAPIFLPYICPNNTPALVEWGRRLLHSSHKWHKSFPVAFSLSDKRANAIQLYVVSSIFPALRSKSFKHTREILTVLLHSIPTATKVEYDILLRSAPVLFSVYGAAAKEFSSEQELLAALQAPKHPDWIDIFEDTPNFPMIKTEAKVIAKKCAQVLLNKIEAIKEVCSKHSSFSSEADLKGLTQMLHHHFMEVTSTKAHFLYTLHIMPILADPERPMISQWGHAILETKTSLAHNLPLILQEKAVSENRKVYQVLQHAVDACGTNPQFALKLNELLRLVHTAIAKRPQLKNSFAQIMPIVIEVAPQSLTTQANISQREIDILYKNMKESFWKDKVSAQNVRLILQLKTFLTATDAVSTPKKLS